MKRGRARPSCVHSRADCARLGGVREWHWRVKPSWCSPLQVYIPRHRHNTIGEPVIYMIDYEVEVGLVSRTDLEFSIALQA